jgi:hypothetical protein
LADVFLYDVAAEGKRRDARFVVVLVLEAMCEFLSGSAGGGFHLRA